MATIFEPTDLSGIRLANRLVRSATWEGLADREGRVTAPLIQVYEDLEAFWFEDVTPAGGRTGHLHRDADKAKGHPVPHLPIPEDFT